MRDQGSFILRRGFAEAIGEDLVRCMNRGGGSWSGGGGS